MLEKRKKEVCLWNLEQLALIILCKSGVEYYNQVGGHFCLHKSDEGIFTLVCDDLKYILDELSSYMTNKYKLTNEDADFIDNIFFKNGAGYIKFDRSRLEDSMEAWVYVDLLDEHRREEYLQNRNDNDLQYRSSFNFWGFDETKGVLTWSNSD